MRLPSVSPTWTVTFSCDTSSNNNTPNSVVEININKSPFQRRGDKDKTHVPRCSDIFEIVGKSKLRPPSRCPTSCPRVIPCWWHFDVDLPPSCRAPLFDFCGKASHFKGFKADSNLTQLCFAENGQIYSSCRVIEETLLASPTPSTTRKVPSSQFSLFHVSRGGGGGGDRTRINNSSIRQSLKNDPTTSNAPPPTRQVGSNGCDRSKFRVQKVVLDSKFSRPKVASFKLPTPSIRNRTPPATAPTYPGAPLPPLKLSDADAGLTGVRLSTPPSRQVAIQLPSGSNGFTAFHNLYRFGWCKWVPSSLDRY